MPPRVTARVAQPQQDASATGAAAGRATNAPEVPAPDPDIIVRGEVAVEEAGEQELALAADAALGPHGPHDPLLVAISEASLTAASGGTTDHGRPASRGIRVLRRSVRFLGGFAFGLLAVLALSAGGLYAFDLQYADRVLPGVHVGAVDLSGLTRAQASARLAEAYSGLASGELVLRAADREARLNLAELGRRPDVEAMVAEAMAVGRDGSGLDRLVLNARTAAQGATLSPRVLVPQSALAQAVATFASTASVAPVDARVAVRGPDFAVTPGTEGRSIDSAGLLAAASQAIAAVEIPARVVVDAAVTTVEPVITTAEVNAAVALARVLEADLTISDGTHTWVLAGATIHPWISFQVTGAGGYVPVARSAGLEGQLAAWGSTIARAPVDATYLFDRNGAIVGANEGQDGIALDVPGTIAAIDAALARRAAGATVATTAPAMVVIKPSLTTEAAAATAPLMKKLSEWTTYFPISERNGYGANIWIPAMDIDGMVVKPGAWFDFWKAIGPVTRERGYMDGGAIINGHTEPTGALAGGICSASTTVFNAALRAGLKMGARQNHYYYINRYPMGLDATVWQSSDGSTQSMTFQNNTEYPILIRAYKIKNGSAGYVKVEIHGVPDGRTVIIDDPIIKNVNKAIDNPPQETSTLPAGTTQRVEVPTDGMDVWRTVTVKDANGAVMYSTTYYSHYARIDGITLIGTG